MRRVLFAILISHSVLAAAKHESKIKCSDPPQAEDQDENRVPSSQQEPEQPADEENTSLKRLELFSQKGWAHH